MMVVKKPKIGVIKLNKIAMTIPFRVKLLTKTAKAPTRENAGKKFGYWTLIKFIENKNSHQYWLCECKCGNKKKVSLKSIKRGDSTSCGCFRDENRKELRKTHGLTNTRTYHVWCGMRSRCNNKKNPKYKDYGARGIQVCDQWMSSFENFISDMGQCPSNKHSIDRINNERGYNKDNCKWSTNKEQQRNTRKNIIIEHKGQKKNLSEWCEFFNIPYSRVYRRLKKGYNSDMMFYKGIFPKFYPSKMEIVKDIEDTGRGGYNSTGY